MSYRGSMDNANFRNQMRPKGRAPFKHVNCDPMVQPVSRGRYVLPGQQPQYQPSVAYQRNAQYPTIHSPEYTTVQYSQQVAGAPPNWNASIPMNMADSYQMPAQHNYPTQQQVYNPETTHMIAIPNNAYIPQVQNQSDYDPLANACVCSKCGFPNSLAHVTMKGLNDEIKRLRELLNAEQQQQQQLVNANYDDGGSSPAPQSTVHASSLSVDAQPFQMGGGQVHKPHQGAHEAADNNSTDGTSRPHNPNGNDYPPRDWVRYAASTPVVSASDVTNDQYNEGTMEDADWNGPDYVHTDNVQTEPSEEPALDHPIPIEPPNVSANVWDQDEPSIQDRAIVSSASGTFVVSSGKREDDDRGSEHNNSTPQNDERDPLKDDRNPNETQKIRPKEQRQKLNRGRGGGRNDGYDNNRDSEGSRRNLNRHESGGSNTSFHNRTLSPQDQKDKRMEKSMPGSRDSSQGGAKSGQESSEKNETDSTDGGVKGFESGDRSPSDKRVDSTERTYNSRPSDSGERFNRKGGGGGQRRFDQGVKGKGAEESNWRQTKDPEGTDRRDERKDGDRRDHFPRQGMKGGGGYRRQAAGPITFKAVVEKEGDLFTAPADYSLAHCVAEDFRMGSGIAVNFRTSFKQVDELLDQRKRVGGVAVLEDKSRYIYYLVTKRRSSGKPMWDDFMSSVEELKKHCVEKGVKNVAMPRIGCGLDRLDWQQVKRLLEETFVDSGVMVTVYNFPQNEEPESPVSKPKSTLYLVHQRKNLVDIDAETGLIFLCAEEITTTNKTIDSLEKKHKIMYDLRTMKKTVGEIISITKGKEYLYGLVVRKNERDPLSYVNLGKCLRKLRNVNSKEKYGYFGLEAFRDEKDPLTMEKVITLVRNVFGGVPYKLEMYVCWPKDLEGDHMWDDQNSATPVSK